MQEKEIKKKKKMIKNPYENQGKFETFLILFGTIAFITAIIALFIHVF